MTRITRITTDPNDPDLTHGVDAAPVPQAAAYLVLSDEERAKGFIRPVRRACTHVGPPGPTHPTRPLTAEEVADGKEAVGWVAFEPYPEGSGRGRGRYWTQAELDAVGKGCGATTTMGTAIAETYARRPSFYGATYCVHCARHLPVGEDGEFVWEGTTERVGT